MNKNLYRVGYYDLDQQEQVQYVFAKNASIAKTHIKHDNKYEFHSFPYKHEELQAVIEIDYCVVE